MRINKKFIACALTAMIFVGLLPIKSEAADAPDMAISAGDSETFAVKKDGTLWGYGAADVIGTGNSSSEDITSPIKVMDQVRSVVSSGGTTFAIKRDNTLWAWGNNSGKFGNSTTEKSAVPIQVMEDVKMVSVNREYSLMIKMDGTLWGASDAPGTAGGNNSTTWTQILSDKKFKFVASDAYYVLAITEEDELWGWGNNSYGCLGIGNLDKNVLPIKIMDDVAYASAAYSSSMFITKNGDLYMCGIGYNGNFFDGTKVVKNETLGGNITTPMKIMSNVLYASTTGNRWAVVKRDNSLWLWGNDSQFGLISDYTKNQMIPVKVMDNVSLVQLGNRHIVVLRNDQSLWTAGQNINGAIAGHPKGDGTADWKVYPFQKDMVDILDAPAAWALAEVREAEYRKLVPPSMQSEYTKTVNRSEFCTLAMTLIEESEQMTVEKYIEQKGLKISEVIPFKDVENVGSRAQNDIIAAYTLGIVSGTSETTFDPNLPITREQAAKMLTLTALALGEDTKASNPLFADDTIISNWAKPFIGYVFDNKVMGGVGANKFDPKGGYQRQQAYMTILRLYNLTK